MRRAHQVTDAGSRLAEVQQAVHAAAIAELVVEPGQRDVVRLARRSVRGHAPARHQEQRDAFGAGRSARDSGQDHVHDVLGQLVLAGRDPHLAAAQVIAAVGLRQRLGADVAHARARVRFRQAHRAEPASLDHGREKARLELGAAVEPQHVRRGLGQERIRVGAGVGRAEPAADRADQRVGQTQPAVRERRGHAEEAGVAVGRDRLADLGNQDHVAVAHAGLVRVRLRRVRRELLRREREALVQHRVHVGPVEVRELGTRRELRHVEPVEQQELEVLAGQRHAVASLSLGRPD